TQCQRQDCCDGKRRVFPEESEAEANVAHVPGVDGDQPSRVHMRATAQPDFRNGAGNYRANPTSRPNRTVSDALAIGLPGFDGWRSSPTFPRASVLRRLIKLVPM